MKWLALFLCPLAANAKLQWQVGALTYHLDNSGYSQFSNKIGSGFIANPIVGVANCDNLCGSVFTGANSVGRPLMGVTVSPATTKQLLHVGYKFIGGAYIDENQPFTDRGLVRYATLPAGELGITPIIGLELSIKPLNLLLTPALVLIYLSFD